MIWEPFVLALVLGLLVSAGLYFAYLWPAVEPSDEDDGPPTRQTPEPPANAEADPRQPDTAEAS